ncbi:MAG: hypothetical protein EKK49_17995 [Rhodocyclaceae bacterium]|nr:MAG: hypothetical protein EKK49_17995 [Rhodocyclaceae bacterium]
MNTTLVALRSDEHRMHGFRRVENYRFALNQPVVAVQLAELSALVPTLPLAFAKLPGGRFMLVAVTGFADGRNLMINEAGRWGGLYLPNQFRAYPFSLQVSLSGTEGQSDPERRFVLCFDHASGLYRETPSLAAGEVRFFDDEGQPQPMIQEISNFLTQTAVAQEVTQQAVAALEKAELLTPWQLPAESEQQLPKGLYRVDEARLQELDGAQLDSLHRLHALSLAYGHLFSMSRVVVLQRLQQEHRKHVKVPPAVDLDLPQKLFDLTQSDTLKFNW